MRKTDSGLTFLGSPYIPVILKHDTKDVLFFNLSGQRSSSPSDQYGTVPTAAERFGDLSGLSQTGTPATIYDPKTGQPFPNNIIPAARISSQATSLLAYVPYPSLTGQTLNYRRLTSAQTNTTIIGLRYIRSFGSSSGRSPLMGLIRQYLGQGGSGLRQNINANFNYFHTASDEVNLFPQLGGKLQTHRYSLQLGLFDRQRTSNQ